MSQMCKEKIQYSTVFKGFNILQCVATFHIGHYGHITSRNTQIVIVEFDRSIHKLFYRIQLDLVFVYLGSFYDPKLFLILLTETYHA